MHVGGIAAAGRKPAGAENLLHRTGLVAKVPLGFAAGDSDSAGLGCEELSAALALSADPLGSLPHEVRTRAAARRRKK
jgi:hypothetical protein